VSATAAVGAQATTTTRTAGRRLGALAGLAFAFFFFMGTATLNIPHGVSDAKLVWRLSVHTDGAGRTVLSVRLEGRGSDTKARSRMLSSWTFLEELAESHAQRLARTVDDFVNAREDDAYEEQPAARPRLLAAV